MELIGKGAEANIYRNGNVVAKERISKGYRVKELDIALRKGRTRREAKLISLARRIGVATPFVYDVDNINATVEIGFVEGKQVKKIIAKVPASERAEIFREIGRSVGKLHSNNIIHGDLTTSNMIVKGGKIYFIDFGLGEINEDIEAKGVDILVFKKTLRSTHHKYEKECFEAFLKGYSSEYSGYKGVLERLKEIESRGRYFAERF